MGALETANGVRAYRKELKIKLKAGQRPVVDVITNPETELDTMKVFDLLVAAPKVGRVRANKWLSVARVSPSKTLGGLTDRQRRELAAIIGGSPLMRPRPVLY